MQVLKIKSWVHKHECVNNVTTRRHFKQNVILSYMVHWCIWSWDQIPAQTKFLSLLQILDTDSGVTGVVSQNQNDRGVALTNNLYLVPKLRMVEVILLLPIYAFYSDGLFHFSTFNEHTDYCWVYRLWATWHKIALSTPWKHKGEVDVELHSFLSSALDGRRWTILLPVRLPPGNNPGRIESWGGPHS
jgi:hypothetical protein